jgi:hypothetical protein
MEWQTMLVDQREVGSRRGMLKEVVHHSCEGLFPVSQPECRQEHAAQEHCHDPQCLHSRSSVVDINVLISFQSWKA